MGPVSIVGLSGASLSIGFKAGQIVKQLDCLMTQYKNAEQTATLDGIHQACPCRFLLVENASNRLFQTSKLDSDQNQDSQAQRLHMHPAYPLNHQVTSEYLSKMASMEEIQPNVIEQILYTVSFPLLLINFLDLAMNSYYRLL